MIHIRASPIVLIPPKSNRKGTAGARGEKLPLPTANPAATRPTTSRIFSPVSAFWTRAPASSPRVWRKGKGAMIRMGKRFFMAAASGGRPEGGARPPGEPQAEHDHGMVEVLHQEARGREDARPDHVGDDDVGQGEEAEPALEPVRGSLGCHGTL